MGNNSYYSRLKEQLLLNNDSNLNGFSKDDLNKFYNLDDEENNKSRKTPFKRDNENKV
jgi:hypothetical protein